MAHCDNQGVEDNCDHIGHRSRGLRRVTRVISQMRDMAQHQSSEHGVAVGETQVVAHMRSLALTLEPVMGRHPAVMAFVERVRVKCDKRRQGRRRAEAAAAATAAAAIATAAAEEVAAAEAETAEPEREEEDEMAMPEVRWGDGVGVDLSAHAAVMRTQLTNNGVQLDERQVRDAQRHMERKVPFLLHGRGFGGRMMAVTGYGGEVGLGVSAEPLELLLKYVRRIGA